MAESLIDAPSPLDALVSWLRTFIARTATYRGLPESAMASARQEGSQLYDSCHRMTRAGARLITRAQEAGVVHRNLAPDDLLALAAAVSWVGEQTPDDAQRPERLLALVVDAITVKR